MIRKYYSFKDCIYSFTHNSSRLSPYGISPFVYFFDAIMAPTAKYLLTFDYTSKNIEILWQELYSRYLLKAITFYDFNTKKEMEEISHNEPEYDFFQNVFFPRIVSLINRTSDYYLTLLNGYEKAKTNLLADIKTTTKNISKYNDTPQGETSEISYLDDDYLTNVNQSTTEVSTPLTTLMARLAEIQNSYKSILNDWVDEFKGLFMEENI